MAATGGTGGSGESRLRKGTDPGSLDLTVTQNLFNGNRTVNGVRQAESNIFGARESLRDTEQNVLLNGATAYMNVLRDTAILDLRKNKIIVLEEQLRQTHDRFIVGEVTRTDGRTRQIFVGGANPGALLVQVWVARIGAHQGARHRFCLARRSREKTSSRSRGRRELLEPALSEYGHVRKWDGHLSLTT